MDACRSCQAPIRFALTPKQRRMPLDAAPSADGNVEVADGVAIVLAGDRLADARGRGVELYTSHFATCPDAAQHRRRS